MKSVLISIQPKWCELIANGKKTVEVRKTKPKIDVPFKCYIYCTKDNSFAEKTLRGFDDNSKAIYYKANKGKVIGEFVCDRIDFIEKRGIHNNFDYCYLSLSDWGNDDIEIEITDIKKSCISNEELNLYGENSPCLYAWHISNLVIYDKPIELSEFSTPEWFRDCEKQCTDFELMRCPVKDSQKADKMCGWCRRAGKPVTRPPQSWCYVEELGA